MAVPGSNVQLKYISDLARGWTVGSALRARAAMTPDEPFVSFEGTTTTFAETLTRGEQTASALAELGVGRGSTVAVMLPNCPEFLDIWFACALLGAVLVPVNAGLRGEGLRYIVEHSESNVVVCDGALSGVFDDALPTTGPKIRLVRGESSPAWLALDELIAGTYAAPAWPDVQHADLASILYTSGTTGLPKGVMNCHNAYLVAGSEFARRHVAMRESDILYTSLPLFHVNAQMLTTMGSLLSGRPMVLAPRFSASGFFDDLRRHGATIFNYIGAMLTMLYKQPTRADDGDNPCRLAIGGAAPKELWRNFERRFDLDLLEIYGLTETATYCLGSPPGDIRVGKVGVPVSWAIVQVHDGDGREVAPGVPGEIVVRPKQPDILFHGYFKNPDATNQAMRDGWFHSGDRGMLDADGYFAFIDRIKDSIRRRGENISSYEVERIVNSYPHVEESAAVGVPSELGEEDVLIAVVARDGAIDPADLIAYCSERMAAFMIPRYVRICSELPKTATQRVQKYLLRSEGTRDAWDREVS